MGVGLLPWCVPVDLVLRGTAPNGEQALLTSRDLARTM